MQWNLIDTTRLAAGIGLTIAASAAAQGSDPIATVAVTTSHATHAWPWLAMGAIAALVGVISYATRRRSPFGK